MLDEAEEVNSVEDGSESDYSGIGDGESESESSDSE